MGKRVAYAICMLLLAAAIAGGIAYAALAGLLLAADALSIDTSGSWPQFAAGGLWLALTLLGWLIALGRKAGSQAGP